MPVLHPDTAAMQVAKNLLPFIDEYNLITRAQGRNSIVHNGRPAKKGAGIETDNSGYDTCRGKWASGGKSVIGRNIDRAL
jgi:hypothetical protein